MANIVETGEFVWNLATRPLAEAMNNSSITLPRGGGRIRLRRRHAVVPGARSERVASPVNFECRLTNASNCKPPPGNRWRPGWCWARVVAVHLDRRCWMNTASTRPPPPNLSCRAGGLTAYYGISEQHRFRI